VKQSVPRMPYAPSGSNRNKDTERVVLINSDRSESTLSSSVGRSNCCWPSPVQPFLVPSPAGLITIFTVRLLYPGFRRFGFILYYLTTETKPVSETGMVDDDRNTKSFLTPSPPPPPSRSTSSTLQDFSSQDH
jgi:hypothetical protein